ncbi:phosphotransferase [Amaricoccus tamworthensis]|uniref:phosphotransferase n=1 Tax=Amaricoccus tamworthensis TaxID=57002 RepID=UPI003C7972C1
MEENRDRVIGELRQLEAFANIPEAEIRVTRMGGLTNLVYRADAPGESVVVRIPGEGTEEYIDRKVEAHNAEAAWRAGISPKVLMVTPDSGVMITETIPNVTTMTPAGFAEIPGAAERAGKAMAQLHGSGQRFDFHFELFAMIEDYLGVLGKRDTTLPEGYHETVKAAEPVKAALAAHPVHLAPCHCDPLSENFLDDGAKMWMVDWEYSGMNDPLWDVGDLAVEAELSPEGEAELLQGYFGRDATDFEMGRFVIYKAMCDLLWTLWGLIQHSDGNTAEDFWAYSTGRFDRCRALINSREFSTHVANVAKG